jgi:hypothetical protein
MTMARIVAVGDVHGDLDALIRILAGMSILDVDGRWCAHDTQLVLIGDLNDRGPESVNVMDFVMALESEAEEAGGRVRALLGNHELLAVQQDYRYMRPAEFGELEGFAYGGLTGVDAIFRGDSPYARWIRKRPALLKIGTTMFVHAGLQQWGCEWTPDQVNAHIASWVAYFQGVGESPDLSSLWLIEEDGGGPLWTRHFGALTLPSDDPAELRARLNHILEGLGTERLVVGHVPTEYLGFEIAFPHSVYGWRVAAIDTGISRHFGGRLSAFEIIGDGCQAHYFERGSVDLPLTAAVRTSCVARRNHVRESSTA